MVWIYIRTPGHTLKGKVSLALRLAVTLLLTLALAGTQVLGAASRQVKWILVDASASAAAQRTGIDAAVKEALQNAPADTQIGIIAFGQNAMVERPLGTASGYAGVTTRIDAHATNLTDALTLAAALTPQDASGGVAVITDGKVEEVSAQGLLARGMAADVLILPAANVPDAQVSAINAPRNVYQEQSFTVTVDITSNMETSATLVLLANREAVATREITLRAGENTFAFQDVAAATGVVAYEAQLIAASDAVSVNNRLGAYITVEGAPSVLLVEGTTGDAREWQKLLQAAGMQVTVLPPEGMPSDTSALTAYHAIVLCNVDIDRVTDSQLAALESAVRLFGRGLIVSGGDSSYALGGYRGSALEQLLPVTIDVKNQMDMPTLALVLALDKSGSMTDGQYGITRLEVAKSAAVSATDILTPRDQVGVIAFDDAAQWVVQLQLVSDLAAIQSAIGTIRPGGGTAFYSPLQAAYNALKDADAQLKHVIFLTDGEPGDSGYDLIVRQMADAGITLTTVAVGDGANVQLLHQLATLGNGRAYAAGQFDNVPKIFTKETMLVAGSYVQNRVFTPIIYEESALTAFEGFPQLTGYLATKEKPLAHVTLMSDREEPVLAWWQYGAGRVLAWTSDAKGGWTSSFLAWQEASTFFSGMVSFALPNQEHKGEVALLDGKVRYTAPEGSGSAATSLTAILPGGEEVNLPMAEVSPDVYEAALDTSAQGAYALRVLQTHADGTATTQDGGGVVRYSAEYDLRAAKSDEALQLLTATTGGRMVDTAQELLSSRSQAHRAKYDLTTPLLIAALVLFVLDVAVRRFAWEDAVKKARQQRTEKAPVARAAKPRKASPAKPAEASPTQTSDKLTEAMNKKKLL